LTASKPAGRPDSFGLAALRLACRRELGLPAAVFAAYLPTVARLSAPPLCCANASPMVCTV